MTLNFTIHRTKYNWQICLFILLSYAAHAQQDAQFSLFNQNTLYNNPATAGSSGRTQIQLAHRTQYVGYKTTNMDQGGALSTQMLSYSMPIKNFGFGISAINDKSTVRNNQDIKLAASYFIPAGGGKLYFGVGAGIFRQALDYGPLRPEEEEDPLILSGKKSEMKPDLNAGIQYVSDAFHVGLSMTHLLKPQFSLGSTTATNPLPPTAYLNAGVNLAVGYAVQVQPMVLVKSDLNTLSVEGGASVTIKDTYWVGATYRHQDAYLIAMAGVYLLQDQSLRLSGAYDFVASGKKEKSPSSLEVMLTYSLPNIKVGKKTIIRTPRFRF